MVVHGRHDNGNRAVLTPNGDGFPLNRVENRGEPLFSFGGRYETHECAQIVQGEDIRQSSWCADADVVAARLVEAGATALREVADQEDGHRRGVFLDPFGYRWFVGQTVDAP